MLIGAREKQPKKALSPMEVRLAGRVMAAREKQSAKALSPMAVSYTHLTLPTICSV